MTKKLGVCWQAQLDVFYLMLGLFDTTIDSFYNNARVIASEHPSMPWWGLFVMDGCAVVLGLVVIFFQGEFAHVTSPAKRTAQALSRFTTFYFGIACTESGLSNLYPALKLWAFPGLQYPVQQLLADVVAIGVVSIGLFHLYRFSAIRTEVTELDVLSGREGGHRPQEHHYQCPTCRSMRSASGGTVIN